MAHHLYFFKFYLREGSFQNDSRNLNSGVLKKNHKENDNN